MDEINAKYRELCIILGDIEVKLKGLGNQKAQIFKELESLDQQAAEVMKKQEKDLSSKETGETRGI